MFVELRHYIKNDKVVSDFKAKMLKRKLSSFHKQKFEEVQSVLTTKLRTLYYKPANSELDKRNILKLVRECGDLHSV